MHSSCSDTTFCKSQIQCFAFVPLILICAREYSFRSQGLNPAFGIAFLFFYAANTGQWSLFRYEWAIFLGPFFGALVAWLFFEFFYRRFLLIYKERQAEEQKERELKERGSAEPK